MPVDQNELEFGKQVASVRQQANVAIRRFQAVPAPQTPSESILLRNSHLCGIRFIWGAFQALWFTDQETIQIFRERQLLETLVLNSSAESHRRAA